MAVGDEAVRGEGVRSVAVGGEGVRSEAVGGVGGGGGEQWEILLHCRHGGCCVELHGRG